jgi:hypothetical protein
LDGKIKEPILQKCMLENIHVLAKSPLCGTHEKMPIKIHGMENLSPALHKNTTWSIAQQAIPMRSKMVGVVPRPNELHHILRDQQIVDFELT